MASNPQDNQKTTPIQNIQTPNSNQQQAFNFGQTNNGQANVSPQFSNNTNSSGFSLFGNRSVGNGPLFSPLFSSPSQSQGGPPRPVPLFGQTAQNSMFPSRAPQQSKQSKPAENPPNTLFPSLFNNNSPKENVAGNTISKSNNQNPSAPKQENKNIFGSTNQIGMSNLNKGPGLFGGITNAPLFGTKKEEQKKQPTVENPKKQSIPPSSSPFSKKQQRPIAPLAFLQNLPYSGGQQQNNSSSTPPSSSINNINSNSNNVNNTTNNTNNANNGGQKKLENTNIMASFVTSGTPELLKSIAPTIPQKFRTSLNTPQNNSSSQNKSNSSSSENKQKSFSLLFNNNNTTIFPPANPTPNPISSVNPIASTNPPLNFSSTPSPSLNISTPNANKESPAGLFTNNQKPQTGLFSNNKKIQNAPSNNPSALNLFPAKQNQPTSGLFGNPSSSSSKSSKSPSLSLGQASNKQNKPLQKINQVVEKEQAVLVKQSSNQPKILFNKPPQTQTLPPQLNQAQPQPSLSQLPPQNQNQTQTQLPPPLGQTVKSTFSLFNNNNNSNQPRLETDPPQTISDNSSILTSKTTFEKQGQKTTRDTTTKNTTTTTTTENQVRKPLSFLKQRQIIVNNQFIDFRTIKQQEKRQTFNSFLSQSMKKIISSFKLYFTTRNTPFTSLQVNDNNNEKTKFLNDLTNLLIKNLGLSYQSWNLLHFFIKKVIAQQKYQQILFRNDNLNADYILNHLFYMADYSNNFYLNETTSKQLILLCQKIVNKWHIEKTNIILFLIRNPDLFHKPSDLFSYLFKYLLQSQNKLIETPNLAFHIYITDFETMSKRKLIQLLNYYNKRLKDFRVITSNQQLKSLIKLIQFSKDEQIEQVSLKILLYSINFKQKDHSHQIFQTIKQTKSFVLIPLRALVYKLGQRKNEFIPNPKDLYKHIKGDQWIDWFDIYLSDSNRQGVQLQTSQPQHIVQSLCTIDGSLLLQRMLYTKKGILKFFNLLRDENMINLYYKILQACIHNERSIVQIQQFYFKKMNFNLQYQQIIEYIMNFTENTKSSNQQSILNILQVKISFLIKILQVSPNKLPQLEKYLFYRDYNKLKKFKPNVGFQSRIEGEKIIHLFLDTINIVSIKNISNKILNRIFSVITSLLKNKHTEKSVLHAMKLNRPSFNFMQNALHSQTLKSINNLLQYILSGTYLQDLIFSYSQCKDQQVRLEGFYPFRYQDQEFSSLSIYYKNQGNQPFTSFSIYWFNQLIKVLNKQRFNPVLVYRILEKLYITPYNPSSQYFSSRSSQVLYRRSKNLDCKIPTIFENIISMLNQLAIWEDIQKILEFKLVKKNGRYHLLNRYILIEKTSNKYKCLFYTLKLVRMIFRLSNLITKYEETCSSHFVVRALSAINFLNKTKINSLFSTHAGKSNILISVVGTFQYQQDCAREISNQIYWEAELQQQEEPVNPDLLKYLSKNHKNIDLQQANNLLKRPDNDLYESQNSIISTSLDILIEILRFSPESSIEHNLTTLLPLREEQKYQVKKQILNKFIELISLYIEDPRIGYKIIEFIYNLKYNCGVNKLHNRLSTKLFDQFIKNNKNTAKSSKFNTIVCKYLLKQLQKQNSNYETFTQQFLEGIITNFKFKDSILNNYYQFKDTREIGRMVKNYQNKAHGLLNLNQIQRMFEERAIIQIAYQFQYITTASDIIITRILKKKQSQSLINCIQLFNNLLLTNNLVLIEKDLPNQFRTSKLTNKFDYNTNEPRLYIRDPIELYITQTKDTSRKEEVQKHQKNNIIQWLLDKSQLVSERITRYIKFILTIDKYPYSNNPISFTVQKNDPANLELFTHLSLGKMNFNANELFGKSSSDSIDTVQGIASNLINRLIEAKRIDQNINSDQSYKEGLRILGYCLQWLRGKDRYGENSSHNLIKKLHKNYFFLLPEGNQIITSQSIKILLSVLSMGEKYFSHEAKGQIHQAIYNLIFKYWMVIQKGFILQEVRSLGELVQQAISILLLIPPEKNESQIFQLLINIWVKQKNYQFFFNESRLILELTTLYPEEIVRLQPLTRCEIVSNLPNFYCRYQQKQRRFDSIAWTWIVKIASQLVNHSLSVLVISQVSLFFKHYKDRFICLFDTHESINRSYAEDLQAVLQLLVCLFSQDLWVNFNRPLAQQITYLLSHNLIKVFIAYVQGRLPFSFISTNDKALCQIKCSATTEEDFNQNIDCLTQDNIFVTYMRIKMNHCLRNYCILMKKAFKSSHFVEVHFESMVFDNKKYFSSFWDIFNKNIVTLFMYTNKQFKIWNSVKKINETLKTLQQCCNAPNTFVENGYLSTIIQLPINEYQLFSDIYLLNYLVAELAVVHYLKQKLYVSKYNNLLASHIDSFSRKIKEHVENVRVQSKRINVSFNQYVTQKEFINITEVVDINKGRKIL